MVLAAISNSAFFCSSEHSTVVIKLRISISFSHSISSYHSAIMGARPQGRLLIALRLILIAIRPCIAASSSPQFILKIISAGASQFKAATLRQCCVERLDNTPSVLPAPFALPAAEFAALNRTHTVALWYSIVRKMLPYLFCDCNRLRKIVCCFVDFLIG